MRWASVSTFNNLSEILVPRFLVPGEKDCAEVDKFHGRKNRLGSGSVLSGLDEDGSYMIHRQGFGDVISPVLRETRHGGLWMTVWCRRTDQV